MIKERPILFSAPMVRAILDGRKTQTRRVIKNTGIAHGIGPVLRGNDNVSEWSRVNQRQGIVGFEPMGMGSGI